MKKAETLQHLVLADAHKAAAADSRILGLIETGDSRFHAEKAKHHQALAKGCMVWVTALVGFGVVTGSALAARLVNSSEVPPSTTPLVETTGINRTASFQEFLERQKSELAAAQAINRR